jgi:hypothetical protein
MLPPCSQPREWVCARVCVGGAFIPCLREGGAFKQKPRPSVVLATPPPTRGSHISAGAGAGAPAAARASGSSAPLPWLCAPIRPGCRSLPRAAHLEVPLLSPPSHLRVSRVPDSAPPVHLFPQKGRILVLAAFSGPWRVWAPAEAIQRGDPDPCFAERGL